MDTYEQKYNEALERAKDILSYKEVRQEDMEYLFPELAESEDERTRKEILNVFKQLGKGTTICGRNYDYAKWIAWLEKQGEQKPVDKIEPKFKVGDWIAKGTVKAQIIGTEDNKYCFDGYKIRCSTIDKNYHLWTIQDAKDGDVLYCKGENEIEYLVINKGINKCGNIDSYIRYNSLNDFGVDIPSVLSIKYDNITPATKEQRALLFQKMNEEGYEWNAELKKVSKITTPADVGFEELGKAWAEEANKQNLANSAKTCKKSQRMVSAEAKEALYDKPAWSEEDEVKVNRIVSWLENLNVADNDILLKDVDWLKSIKQRIKGE